MRPSVHVLTASACGNAATAQSRATRARRAAAFAPARNEIRYTDGNSGFYNVRLTNGAWPKR